MRAHPKAGDGLIAVLLGLVDILFSIGDSGHSTPWFVVIPLDIATVAPLVWRRQRPVLTAYLLLAIGIPHYILTVGFASSFAEIIGLYTVVVYAGRRQGLGFLATLVVVTAFQVGFGPSSQIVISTIVIGFLFVLCWVLGEFVGARRAYDVEVEARLHLLETERDQATKIAVGNERSRIARELHDVVAHAVSVMVVQADGASYAIRSNPELAERAVQTISDTGRGALAELRSLLDVLRNDELGGEPRVPQPNAASVAELAERVRAAGVPVRLEIDSDFGDLEELPTGVSLGIYRIVQESLTNTLKHAGRGAAASVRLQRNGDVVLVEVSDDGAGRAHALVPTRGLTAVSGGNGLIGMRERANVFGGTLDVGPAPGGGWRVLAKLPVRLAQ
jgi:signal transduction histidine kinase